MLLPVAAAFVFLSGNGFYFFAECSLTGQIFLFLGTDAFEMLLVTLVDDSGGRLEAVPDFFAQILADRTNLTIFCMEFLQLVESTNHICLVGQTLGSLTEFGLQFKVLLEIIFAGFTVQFQKVIELLHVELVVTPEFTGLFCRHIFDFFPFCLQGFEILIGFIGLFRRGDHCLDFLNDGKFLL